MLTSTSFSDVNENMDTYFAGWETLEKKKIFQMGTSTIVTDSYR